MRRKAFLRNLFGGAAFFSLPGLASAKRNVREDVLPDTLFRKGKGNMVGFRADPIEKVKVGIIGMGNRGKTLIQMFDWLITNGKAEITALSDLVEANVQYGLDYLEKRQKRVPRTYVGDENAWQGMARQEDVDLLVIATPWRWHTPMSVYGMENGKHVASEVPIAYTLDDCWKIVDTAEKTRRHCIMIENCCYNSEELWVLNMVQEGVFGELTHAECAYLHDLRALMFSDTYYQGQWRINHHVDRNGNFYTTHGIGPVSMYMDIGRGDTFQRMTSMSSQEASLSAAAEKTGAPYKSFACGDVNTTLIQTAKGKSIMLQFDVHTGRPYSRINQLVGTKAVHEGYPSRLYIDPEKLEGWGHRWLDEEKYKEYREKYEHPMIGKLKSISESYKQGHGGMDFVMIYRLIDCLNKGLPLDLNVYDAAMWSALTPLSELSVAKKNKTLPFPDFTGDTWKQERALEIMRPL
jgi:predicted dehydrogenase